MDARRGHPQQTERAPCLANEIASGVWTATERIERGRTGMDKAGVGIKTVRNALISWPEPRGSHLSTPSSTPSDRTLPSTLERSGNDPQAANTREIPVVRHEGGGVDCQGTGDLDRIRQLQAQSRTQPRGALRDLDIQLNR